MIALKDADGYIVYINPNFIVTILEDSDGTIKVTFINGESVYFKREEISHKAWDVICGPQCFPVSDDE